MKYNRLRSQEYYRPSSDYQRRLALSRADEHDLARPVQITDEPKAASDRPAYMLRQNSSSRYSHSRSAAHQHFLSGDILSLLIGTSGMLLSVILLGCIVASALAGYAAAAPRGTAPASPPLQPGYYKAGMRGTEISSPAALMDFSIFDIEHRLPESETVTAVSRYDKKEYTHAPLVAGKLLRYGVDISGRNGPVNWLEVRKSGIRFVMLRAGSRGYSEGQLYRDKLFDTNASSAQVVGLDIGVYVYSQATNMSEIAEEARLAIERAQGYRITMPVVLDFEYAEVDGHEGGRLYDAQLSVDEATNMCLAFCDMVRSAGYEPMIYANTYMLRNQLDAERLAQNAQIWIAYPSTEQKYTDTQDMWQYSWKGNVPGVDGDVDMDFGYFE